MNVASTASAPIIHTSRITAKIGVPDGAAFVLSRGSAVDDVVPAAGSKVASRFAHWSGLASRCFSSL
jgi:hypothetical protein